MYCIVLCIVFSVPARLGKGQVAKEIGHNLARERQKIGHSKECARPSRTQFYASNDQNLAQTSTRTKRDLAQFCGRSMKTWAQICKHFTVHQLSEL